MAVAATEYAKSSSVPQENIGISICLCNARANGCISGFSIVLIVLFFVTSSDSGSIVIDTITAGGKLDAPVPQRVFWCLFEGLVAIALLLSGGLGALQAATVSTGFPFGIVMILMCYSLYRALRQHAATALGDPS